MFLSPLWLLLTVPAILAVRALIFRYRWRKGVFDPFREELRRLGLAYRTRSGLRRETEWISNPGDRHDPYQGDGPRFASACLIHAQDHYVIGGWGDAWCTDLAFERACCHSCAQPRVFLYRQRASLPRPEYGAPFIVLASLCPKCLNEERLGEERNGGDEAFIERCRQAALSARRGTPEPFRMSVYR